MTILDGNKIIWYYHLYLFMVNVMGINMYKQLKSALAALWIITNHHHHESALKT